MRFIAEDAGTGSLVEAGVDDFNVFRRECDDTCQLDLGFGGPGDLTLSLCGADLSTGNSATFLIYGLQSTVVNWAPGCDQLVTPAATLFGLLDAMGRLDVPLAVPLDPALRGVAIHTQAAVLDGGPVFGASLSGAIVQLPSVLRSPTGTNDVASPAMKYSASV